MRTTLLTALLLACIACGTSTPFTSQQELAALQGAWSGSGTAINGTYSGPATLTESGSEGTLQIPSASCPATFNLPLNMAPGKSFPGSGFIANGIPASGGYDLSALTGTVNSSSQMTVMVDFDTPYLSSSVDVQFVLTKS